MFKKKLSPLNIICIAVVAVLALAIITTFVLFGIFRDTNKAPDFLGSRVFIMQSDGMEPRIKKGAAVFAEEGLMPTEPGNAVLCSIEGQVTVVGYIGTQPATSSTGEVLTKYVVKYDTSNQLFIIEESDIIGRAISYSTFLGGIIRFASSTAGMLLVVILPCAAIVIYEVVMLVLTMKKKNVGAKSVPTEPKRTYPTYEEEPVRTAPANDYSAWIAANTPAQPEPEEYEEYEAIEPIEEYREPVYEEEVLEEPAPAFNYYWHTEEKEPAPAYEEPVYEEPAPFFTPEVEEPKVEEIELRAETKHEEEPVKDLSSMRIDELMKLLEEEKKKYQN